MSNLNDAKLNQVSGGAVDPIHKMSYEEVMKKVEEFGPESKDMGGWKRISGPDFLRRWVDVHADLYKLHKDEIDAIIGANK